MIGNVSLTDKVVLVTGAASGLGRATALCAAAAGAAVVAVDLAEDRVEAVVGSIRQAGGSASSLVADLAIAGECCRVVAETLSQHRRLDVLCNIAGMLRFHHFAEMPDEEWNAILAVNLTAPALLCKSALPSLIEAKGAIVNVASVAAFKGESYLAAYAASKAALVSLTRSLAMEFSRKDVRINAIAPGGMMTGMAGLMRSLRDPDMDLVARYAPVKGYVDVEDMAAAIIFLASDANRLFHGACLNADMGMTAG